MIKLKARVTKAKLLRELRVEAKRIYKESWQPGLRERDFIKGAEALLELLRIKENDGQ